MRPRPDPIRPFLERQGVLILDGGLATELETRGADLSDALWSARLLLDDPASVRAVHREYLEAGADCITGASYQATLDGLRRRGLSAERARATLARSVALAGEARDAFWSRTDSGAGRLRPLVAASVGPWGAYLADGSEYRGEYGKSEAELVDFHRERWAILAAAGADLLACETIPSRVEALALAGLLERTEGAVAWMSFSCRDGERLADGSDLDRVVGDIAGTPGLLAVGINCIHPRFAGELVARARSATSLPILVYPNTGERWDAAGRRWLPDEPPTDFGAAAVDWRRAGASLIGGCCRTGPAHVRAIRRRLLGG